jgi:hypothetical protein
MNSRRYVSGFLQTEVDVTDSEYALSIAETLDKVNGMRKMNIVH